MNSDKNLTYQQRVDLAMAGRKKGYNCAQALVSAFPDVLQLPLEVALRLSCGFGSGFGGMKKVCGVMSGMTILEGFRAEDGIMGKAGVYRVVRELGDEFYDACGSLECHELKTPGAAMSCNEIIAKGIELYHNYLNNK